MDKKKRSRTYNRPLMIVLIIGILYIVYQFISLEISYHKLVARRDRLAEELAEEKRFTTKIYSILWKMHSRINILKSAQYLGLIRADEKILSWGNTRAAKNSLHRRRHVN